MKIGEPQTGYPVRVLLARMEESERLAKLCATHIENYKTEMAEQEGLMRGYNQRAVACRDALIALGVDIGAVRSGQDVIVGGE